MRSASVKQLIHLGQLMKENNFKKFDYGTWFGNIAKYGSSSPPSIDLQNIPSDFPIALLVGKYDTLADKYDVDKLAAELDQRVVMHKEYDNFDHYGFSVGKDMSWTNDVVELIQSVDQSNDDGHGDQANDDGHGKKKDDGHGDQSNDDGHGKQASDKLNHGNIDYHLKDFNMTMNADF